MNLVLLGLPGAGKGTQASLLEDEHGIPHVSTGDMFRQAINNETELGQKAREYMEAGELVPDEVTIGLVRDRLARDDSQSGFILDGFPRTIGQAKALDEMLGDLNRELDMVIYMSVPEDELLKRLTGRRVCPECGANYHLEFNPPQEEGICDECGSELIQRDDDREKTVRKRLDVNRSKTEKLKEYYSDRDLLVELDARGSVDEVNQRFAELLEEEKE